MLENYKAVGSQSEREIRAFLQKKNIKFLQEYRFKDLTNEDGIMLPVDFVISVNNNLAIIEYNGSHHVNRRFHQVGRTEDKAEIRFNRRVMNDLARKNFSKENKIPLLTISHRDGNKKLEIIQQFIKDLQARCSDFKLYGKDSSANFYSQNSVPRYSIKDVFKQNVTELTVVKNAQPTKESQLAKRLAYSSDQLIDLENELKEIKNSYNNIKNERDQWRNNYLELRTYVDKLEKAIERNKLKNRQSAQSENVNEFEITIGELAPELEQFRLPRKDVKSKIGELLRKVLFKMTSKQQVRAKP